MSYAPSVQDASTRWSVDMRWISANNPREMPDSPGFGMIREPASSGWYSGPVSRTLPSSPFLSISKPSVSTVPYHWSYSNQPSTSAAASLCRTYEYAPLQWGAPYEQTIIRNSNGSSLPTFSGGIVRSRSYYHKPNEYRILHPGPVSNVMQRDISGTTMQSNIMYPDLSTKSLPPDNMGNHRHMGGPPVISSPSPIVNKLPPIMMRGVVPGMSANPHGYPSSVSMLPPLLPRQRHEPGPVPIPPRPSPLVAERPPEVSYNPVPVSNPQVVGQSQPWWMESSHPTFGENSVQQSSTFHDSGRPIRVQNAFAQQYVNGAVRHHNESEVIDNGHRLYSHAGGSRKHSHGFDDSGFKSAGSFDRESMQYNMRHHSRMRSERKRDKRKCKPAVAPSIDNELYVSSKLHRDTSLVPRRRRPCGAGCCSNTRAGNGNFEVDPRNMRRKSSSIRKQLSGQQVLSGLSRGRSAGIPIPEVPQIIHATPNGGQGVPSDLRDSDIRYRRPPIIMDNQSSTIQHGATPVRSRLLSYKNYLVGSEFEHNHHDGHVSLAAEHPMEDKRNRPISNGSHSPPGAPHRFKSFDGVSHQTTVSQTKRYDDVPMMEHPPPPHPHDDEPERRRSHYKTSVVPPPSDKQHEVKPCTGLEGTAAPLLPKRCDLSDLSVLTSASMASGPPGQPYRNNNTNVNDGGGSLRGWGGTQNGRLCSRHEKQTMDGKSSSHHQRSYPDMLCNPIERIRWLEHTVDILSVFLRSLLKAAKVNSAGALIELVREIGKHRPSSKGPPNVNNFNNLNVPEKLHDFHGSPSAVSTVSYGISESVDCGSKSRGIASIPGSYLTSITPFDKQAMSEDEANNPTTDPNHLLKILKLIEEVVSSLDIPPQMREADIGASAPPMNDERDPSSFGIPRDDDDGSSTDHHHPNEEEEEVSHPNGTHRRSVCSSSTDDDPADDEEHLDITPSDDGTSTPVQVDMMLNPSSSSDGTRVLSMSEEAPLSTSVIPNLPLTTVSAGAWMTGNVTAGDTYFEE